MRRLWLPNQNAVHSATVGGERTRVRDHIVSALYADLVGPFEGAQAHLTSRELLRQRPSAWYLTGFLVPEGKQDSEEGDDELGVGDDVQADEAESEEQEPKQRKTFPASMGFSVLLPPADKLKSVDVTISFAQYAPEWIKPEGTPGPRSPSLAPRPLRPDDDHGSLGPGNDRQGHPRARNRRRATHRSPPHHRGRRSRRRRKWDPGALALPSEPADARREGQARPSTPSSRFRWSSELLSRSCLGRIGG